MMRASHAHMETPVFTMVPGRTGHKRTLRIALAVRNLAILSTGCIALLPSTFVGEHVPNSSTGILTRVLVYAALLERGLAVY